MGRNALHSARIAGLQRLTCSILSTALVVNFSFTLVAATRNACCSGKWETAILVDQLLSAQPQPGKANWQHGMLSVGGRCEHSLAQAGCTTLAATSHLHCCLLLFWQALQVYALPASPGHSGAVIARQPALKQLPALLRDGGKGSTVGRLPLLSGTAWLMGGGCTGVSVGSPARRRYFRATVSCASDTGETMLDPNMHAGLYWVLLQ